MLPKPFARRCDSILFVSLYYWWLVCSLILIRSITSSTTTVEKLLHSMRFVQNTAELTKNKMQINFKSSKDNTFRYAVVGRQFVLDEHKRINSSVADNDKHSPNLMLLMSHPANWQSCPSLFMKVLKIEKYSSFLQWIEWILVIWLLGGVLSSTFAMHEVDSALLQFQVFERCHPVCLNWCATTSVNSEDHCDEHHRELLFGL